MDTTATLQKGRLVRPLALIVALASLALAASAIAQPAFAGDSYQVPLHEAHQGADSSTFSPDNDCGDYTTGVVWHFILNQYSGDAAELFDPTDASAIAAALTRLLDDPERRAELVARGHERWKAFSWERAAAETLEVYERALGAESRSR